MTGDIRRKYGWENMAWDDRDDCWEYLCSDGVEVRCWYGTDKPTHGRASANFNAWIVHRGRRPLIALNGSARLTRNGLESNVEAMTEAHGRDLAELWQTASRLWGQAWECDDRLLGYIEAPPRPQPPRPQSPSPPPQSRREVSSGRFPVFGVVWWASLCAVVMWSRSPIADVLLAGILVWGIVLGYLWMRRGESGSLRRRMFGALVASSRGRRRRRPVPPMSHFASQAFNSLGIDATFLSGGGKRSGRRKRSGGSGGSTFSWYWGQPGSSRSRGSSGGGKRSGRRKRSGGSGGSTFSW